MGGGFGGGREEEGVWGEEGTEINTLEYCNNSRHSRCLANRKHSVNTYNDSKTKPNKQTTTNKQNNNNNNNNNN